MSARPQVATKPARRARAAPRASHARAPACARTPVLRAFDTHERQAHLLADRFMAGDLRLGHATSAAPASRAWLPGSVGQPLPAGLRATLETAFEADLGNLRIHADADAARAAQAIGANAFASGAHLVFNDGRFRPDTPRGRHLLAHEVAHALQQAGRVTTGGRLRVVEVDGSAPPQRDAMPDIDQLTSLHAPAVGSAARAAYDELAVTLSGFEAQPKQAATLLRTWAARTVPRLKALNWPWQAESLLYDALKRHALFDLAATMIDRNDFAGGPHIETVSASPEVSAELEKRHGNWGVHALAITKLPWLKDYEQRWLKAIERFALFDDDLQYRELASHKGGGTLSGHVNELFAQLSEGRPSVNEWMFNALLLMFDLDQNRIKTCGAIHDAAWAGKHVQAIDAAMLRAKGLVDWGKDLPDAASTFADILKGRSDAGEIKIGLSKYLKALGESVGKIGNHALVVWQSNRSLERATGVDAAERAAELTELRAAAGPLGLRTGLAHLLAQIFEDLGRGATDPAARLDPLEWRKRTAGWMQRLDAMSAGDLKDGILTAFHSGKAIDVRAWMALDNFAKAVRASLEGIGSGTDARGAAWVQTLEDVAYRRIHLAGGVHAVCQAVGWKAAEAATRAILEAKDEHASVLALLRFDDGTWFKQDPLIADEMVRQARLDFNRAPLRGLEPFTLDTLALFYQAGYYRELTQQMRLRLPSSDAEEERIVTLGLAVPYLAHDAQTALKVFRVPPQRWHGAGVAFAGKVTDKRKFVELLQAHQAVKDLEQQKRPENFQTIVPDRAADLPLWFIPPYVEIYESIHGSLVMQGFVAASFDAALPAPERMSRQAMLTREEWLARLQQVFAEKMKDPAFVEKQWPGILEHLYALVSDDYSKAATDHRAVLTRTLRRDRRLVANQIRATYAEYIATPRIPLPLHAAVGQILEFNRIVGALSDVERRRQLGLLMLEIGQPMQDALHRVTEIELVAPMLGFALQGMQAIKPLTGMRDAERATWLPPSENSDSWLAENTAILAGTLEHLSNIRAKEQNAQGFEANATTKEITAYVKLSKPLPVYTLLQPRYNGLLGDPSSTAYRVTEIMRSFVYHPAYGDAPILDKNAPTGHAPAVLLELDGKTPLKASDTEPLIRIDHLRVIKDAPPGPTQWEVYKTEEVNRTQSARLADLANGTLWAGFVSAMGTIESGIEGIINMYLDLIELLPGIGPAVAAARIGAAIAEFLASADYAAIASAVKGGFVDIVKGVLDALTGKVDSQSVFLLLLFGDPRLDAILANTSVGLGGGHAAAGAVGAGTSEFGRLGALLHGFKRLGHGVAKALREVDHFVERPMQDVRIAASTGPLLSFVLQFAATHIYEIETLTMLLVDELRGGVGKDEERTQGLRNELREQQGGFSGHIHDALEAIQHFELPRQVVDIAPVFASVIELAISFVMKRTGFVGKIINVVLKDAGVYQYVTNALAKELIGTSADPNKYWQEHVLTRVQKDFNSARNDVVAGIDAIFHGPEDPKLPPKERPFFGDIVPAVGAVPDMTVGTDAKIGFHETDENYIAPPDTKPLPSADRPLVARPAQLPHFGEGLPLPAAARARFEHGTGQDMGHVRLHTGGVGDAMTAAFGADALTSGSHVFVRNGKLDSALDHELVHVLQQTGPRPIGRRHGNTPVKGHPERGLDFRPDSEAEAHDVASALRSGRRADAPVRGGGGGLQPMLDLDLFTVQNLLRHVSDLNTVVRTAKTAAASETGGEVSAEVGKALGLVVSTIQDPTKAAWLKKGPFFPVYDLIGRRFKTSAYATHLKTGATTVAAQAMEPVDKASDKHHYLSRAEFSKHLEAVILARTGILLDIDFNSDALEPKGVDLENPVKSIKVRHVHLPFIDGHSELWSRVIANTWKGENKTWQKRMRRTLRPLLQAEGVRIGLWPILGSKYAFGDLFKLQAEAALKSRDAEDPAAVPWRSYVDTSMHRTDDNTGLRLSTYDHDSQRGQNRESHHLTQYLVGQYFANENDTKAFDQPRVYPGVVPFEGSASTPLSGRKVGRIAAAAQGSDGIQVATTSGNGRGGQMPTISLAAMTHQQGKLHITPEADDKPANEVKSRSTQAGMLANYFRSRLPKEVSAKPEPDEMTAFSQGRGKDTSKYPGADGKFDRWVHDTGGPDTVASLIHDAVQATYAKVEAHMSTQLKANMVDLEFQYFMGLVEDTAHDISPEEGGEMTEQQKLFRAELEKIPQKAKEHNADGLAQFGWKTTK